MRLQNFNKPTGVKGLKNSSHSYVSTVTAIQMKTPRASHALRLVILHECNRNLVSEVRTAKHTDTLTVLKFHRKNKSCRYF